MIEPDLRGKKSAYTIRRERKAAHQLLMHLRAEEKSRSCFGTRSAPVLRLLATYAARSLLVLVESIRFDHLVELVRVLEVEREFLVGWEMKEERVSRRVRKAGEWGEGSMRRSNSLSL